MSSWEQVRDGVLAAEKEKEAKAKSDKGSKINNLLTDITVEALSKVDPSKIEVDNIPDLKSLSDMYNKVRDNESSAQGGGKLPPLSTGMENIIENAVHVSYRSVKQDDGSVTHEKLISADDIANMSPEEIAELMTRKEELQNNENASKIL